MPKVFDFYEKLNEIAPFKAAYDWDNVGLLIGDINAPVKRVLFALDITDKIVEYAIAQKIDLIISHHPVIFQGVKNICQKRFLRLIENQISVISAHTNLDVSRHGVNFVLAETLGLKSIKPLSMSHNIAQYQISVYTPYDFLEKVMFAMNEAGAGNIGDYSHCATYFETLGQYKPLENSTPFEGQKQQLQKVKEMKLEVFCEETNLQNVLKAMFITHPYETPAYTVIPLKQKSPNYGLGCYGILPDKMSLKDFSIYVKNKLEAPFVKLWLAGKDENLLVQNIAVCGGAGNSIIHEAKQVADVYVSSDLNYHQFLDAPLPVIDAGHFFTENPVMQRLGDIFHGFDCEMIVVTKAEHDITDMKVITDVLK